MNDKHGLTVVYTASSLVMLALVNLAESTARDPAAAMGRLLQIALGYTAAGLAEMTGI